MKLASDLWTRWRKSEAMRRIGDEQNTQSGSRDEGVA
jgi:hypothetical protein